MKTIFTVACEIPGDFGQYVGFASRASLLDADFVLLEPSLGENKILTEYRGKPVLSDTSSFRLQEDIAHWRRELKDVLDAGRTVFVLMTAREEVYVNTGEKEYSGTGRNRQTTNMVRLLSNYDSLPVSATIVESKGTSMMLFPGERILGEYWQQFGEDSTYQVHIAESEGARSLVVTRHGQRVVGAIFRAKAGGSLVVLPWINLYRDEFLADATDNNDGIAGETNEEGGSEWTQRAVEWGRRYVGALESLDGAIRQGRIATPVPAWAGADDLRTKQEVELSERLLQVQFKISDLEKKRTEIGGQLEAAGSLKRLLFGQGKELETAILEAMELMGFVANQYRSSDSEFDAVLECDEGRCIGEVEGKDNRAIGIDKMRQLEVNILEDLSRDEVSEPAKGVLFGNAYRLRPPSERPDAHFTVKCMSAAKRNGTAMVRTCRLFDVARVLADEPNEKFATLCRKAILETAGDEVDFPRMRDSSEGAATSTC